MKRRDECRQSITEKVSNIKAMHSAVTELDPKLQEMYLRMRKAEAKNAKLEELISKKEEEIRLVLFFFLKFLFQKFVDQDKIESRGGAHRLISCSYISTMQCKVINYFNMPL